MLNGTYTNYYQPQQQTQNYYQANTSNMYSNPFIASAMQPLPIFNQQQSYAPMQQQSYATQNYNYQPMQQQSYATQNYNYQPIQQQSYSPYQPLISAQYQPSQQQSYSPYQPLLSAQYQPSQQQSYSPYQQQSSISPMLMNILSMLMQFLPMLLGRNSQQLNPVSTTPVYATPAPGTDEVLPNPVAAPETDEVVTIPVADQPVGATQTKGDVFKEVVLDMVGLTDINDEQAAQDEKIAANDAKDAVQETEIAANTTAIAANDAKDVTQDGKISSLEAKIAEFLAKFLAIDSKNATQDSQIAAVVAVNNTQNTTITNNFNLINTRWTSSFGFDLNGNRINIDPLVLDTNKDGKISTQTGTGVSLDDNGTTGAAVDGDKMLAMSDQNGNGQIDAAEVFGTDTINPFTKQKVNARNGFEALKEIAASAKESTGIDIETNGVVNLSKLQEALAKADTKLGLIGDNNVVELEELGEVEAIDSNYTETPTEGMNLQTSSFITKSGEKFETRDVWFTAQ